MTASPTCTKAALNMLGHKVGGLRLPMIEADEHELAEVRAMLVRHGLLPSGGSDGREPKAAASARATGA
jgi:4-hydroxy-tetrahydrodipicolinate synthase